MPTDDADDGYEPALDSTTTAESSTESEPVVKRPVMSAASSAAAALPAAPVEKIGEPQGDHGDATLDQGPRLPRQRSDKNRAMFRDLVKAVQAGEVDTGGDLEPMAHASPPAAAAPAVAAPPAAVTPPAAVAATPAPATPVVAPPGLPPLPDLPLTAAAKAAPATPPQVDPKHAEREAAITAREAALAEREKLMPDRTALAERPGEALVSWLRDVHGITDEAEMKTALTDLVTELSERGLGVTLPPEVKTGMESRKALRSVKAYKATLDKREQSLSEQRAAQDKATAEANATAEQQRVDAAYVARLGELIAPAKETHKFLHDPEVTGGLSAQAIVYEVLKEQKRLGMTPDLASAAEYANNYYKTQAEGVAKKAAHFQSLLAPAPAPAAAPAKAATSPGGVPGPAPTTPTTPPAPEWDPSDLPMDRQQRRAQSLSRLVAARKAANQAQ